MEDANEADVPTDGVLPVNPVADAVVAVVAADLAFIDLAADVAADVTVNDDAAAVAATVVADTVLVGNAVIDLAAVVAANVTVNDDAAAVAATVVAGNDVACNAPVVYVAVVNSAVGVGINTEAAAPVVAAVMTGSNTVANAAGAPRGLGVLSTGDSPCLPEGFFSRVKTGLLSVFTAISGFFGSTGPTTGTPVPFTAQGPDLGAPVTPFTTADEWQYIDFHWEYDFDNKQTTTAVDTVSPPSAPTGSGAKKSNGLTPPYVIGQIAFYWRPPMAKDAPCNSPRGCKITLVEFDFGTTDFSFQAG